MRHYEYPNENNKAKSSGPSELGNCV